MRKSIHQEGGRHFGCNRLNETDFGVGKFLNLIEVWTNGSHCKGLSACKIHEVVLDPSHLEPLTGRLFCCCCLTCNHDSTLIVKSFSWNCYQPGQLVWKSHLIISPAWRVDAPSAGTTIPVSMWDVSQRHQSPNPSIWATFEQARAGDPEQNLPRPNAPPKTKRIITESKW